MNIQNRIDQLTEMLESAKYEKRMAVGDIWEEWGEVVEDLERVIANLEYIKDREDR